MTEITARAVAGFREAFDREPDGVWSAPGRVNLIGEHTDYNEGFVLPFAIDRRTVAAVALTDDGQLQAGTTAEPGVQSSAAEGIEVPLPGWSAYPFGVAWALGARSGARIFLDSDVPVGAGLSSSAAVECSVSTALDELWDLGLSKPELVLLGQKAENEAVGAPTGIMDQSASLLGERDAAVFLDCRTQESEVVPLGLEAAGLEVLVIDTRVKHSHATGGYGERRASCELGARLMGVGSLRDLSVDDLPRAQQVLDDVTFRRVRHIVTENERVLQTVAALRERGPRAIGPLLDASHVSMRDDFEISVPELDLAVEMARATGAIGARMTGGGFGGAAIALVPREQVATVIDAVTKAFARDGFEAPNCFAVRADAGARRES
ncbi:galactokinase [Arenivirga flava]|uniref:Galactokinase n=1 Tax=Arenivirga flava TaxID=1930060 RepID=A0AA37UM24_9MICO|nr:galactokinase [Arenivirga flava]GMA29306.1 galactokinase [Arenivirga flava]